MRFVCAAMVNLECVAAELDPSSGCNALGKEIPSSGALCAFFRFLIAVDAAVAFLFSCLSRCSRSMPSLVGIGGFFGCGFSFSQFVTSFVLLMFILVT